LSREDHLTDVVGFLFDRLTTLWQLLERILRLKAKLSGTGLNKSFEHCVSIVVGVTDVVSVVK